MTSKEFHALAHDYDDSVVQEAKKTLEDTLRQRYAGVKVYTAEAHGGYVFLCAEYRPSEDHATTFDEEYWMEVVDGKCVCLHDGWASIARCRKLNTEV